MADDNKKKPTGDEVNFEKTRKDDLSQDQAGSETGMEKDQTRQEPVSRDPISSDQILDPGLKPDEGAMDTSTNPHIKGSWLRTDLEGYEQPEREDSEDFGGLTPIVPKEPEGEVVIKTEAITMRFGGLTAVRDFNLNLEKGKIIALIGPNGAGKTTAFNMITGVYSPSEGKISYKGQDITGMKPNAITKLGIARTFQNIRLFRDLTVYENVLIGNHLRIKSNVLSAVARLPGYNREEVHFREKTEALLKRVGLWEERAEKAGSLPYGKQRRLEIARALATEPEVLLLDEPAAGMNPKETEDLTMFIKQIRKEFDLTIFMIEHHMQVVMGISDKIYVFDYGITIAEGTPQEIQNDQRVITAYLGVDEDA